MQRPQVSLLGSSFNSTPTFTASRSFIKCEESGDCGRVTHTHVTRTINSIHTRTLSLRDVTPLNIVQFSHFWNSLKLLFWAKEFA